MADPFIAEIVMFGGNFPPRGWAFCDGQLLPISQNTALFSLLGTTYGGDGRTTFGLPDLRGRVPVHAGSGAGPGLPTIRLGQKGGSPENTLVVNNMPSHNHPLLNNAYDDAATSGSPEGNVLASSTEHVYSSAAADTRTAPDTTGNSGGNQSVNNMQPYQSVNFIIALVGVFPSRN